MKFSITIPAYKQRYLFEAIESCLAQTYKDFELIIVDDASPEDLKSVVDKFQDERIRYYRNEKNCGAVDVVDNWNICLGYAKGDYIICMGDDDRLLPNCLEEYTKLIDKHPGLNIYHGMTEIIDEDGNVYDIQEARPEREGVYSMIYGRLVNDRQQYIGDWLIKREWLDNRHGYYKLPLAWGSDDLTAYLAAQEGGVANSQVPVFQYRKNPYTISNSGNCRLKLEDLLKVYGEIEILLNMGMDTDIKEKDYRNALTRKLPLKVKKTKVGIVKQDIANTGRLSGLVWWLLHAHKYNIPQSMVVKAWIKSFGS